ncbi:SDR family NAD(P)-dependent oxidoreductase [Nocardioides acrostichi]|uniref:SDR family oxidoreductase n=1 Tax=Nocardioides acrostichi TaxID=2784339 RepID=A0A930Y521_9ACTN|nr:SDR family oxidoreductase [Nocardioides acrostichi]MBF4160805.1 SDR family oxidoreductase [Nocardioides acrostichi]
MRLLDRVAVVTGAAAGIGAAVGRELHREGARVVFADVEEQGVREAAADLSADGGRAVPFVGDVSREDDLRRLIAFAESTFGPVDLFHANAAISGLGGLELADSDWEAAWQVNVMAHVRAARLLVDGWVERGSGYFVSTASAAGLLTQLGAGPYTLSKHAAVAFAEWLSVTYGESGVRVSCLCPQAVDTQMLATAHEHTSAGALGARAIEASGVVVTPEYVAGCVVEAITSERFLVLPHPEVAEYALRRAQDHDRWLAGMRRLGARHRSDATTDETHHRGERWTSS